MELSDGTYIIGLAPTATADGIPQDIFEIKDGKFKLLANSESKTITSMRSFATESVEERYSNFYGPFVEYKLRSGDWHYFDGNIHGNANAKYRITAKK
jgi:hypothetical protein